jgi:hypothetical protein
MKSVPIVHVLKVAEFSPRCAELRDEYRESLNCYPAIICLWAVITTNFTL